MLNVFCIGIYILINKRNPSLVNSNNKAATMCSSLIQNTSLRCVTNIEGDNREDIATLGL